MLTPNLVEFKQNYINNGKDASTIDSCEWDFVPVSDEKYFPYDIRNDVFLECLQIIDINEIEPTFHSAIFMVEANYADMMGISKELKMRIALIVDRFYQFVYQVTIVVRLRYVQF